nr:BTB/POZ domain protein [Pandoravirus massiliensis]
MHAATPEKDAGADFDPSSSAPERDDAMEDDEATKHRGQVVCSTGHQLITLNVGGEKMTTLRSTFAAAPAGSLLGRMFGPDADPIWAPPRLADGSYFLDLNPRHFAVILNALRHGPAMLYRLSPADRGAITLVADYLGLDLGSSTCLAADVLRYRVAMAPESARFTIAAVSPAAFWPDRIDLCEWGVCAAKITYVPVLRSWTLAEARDMLSSAMNIPADRLVAHMCLRRRNNTVRPEARLPMDSTTIRLDDVHAFKNLALVLLVHRDDFVAGIDTLPAATLRQRPTAGVPSLQAPGDTPAPSAETMKRPPNGPMLIFVRRFDRSRVTLSKARPLLVNTWDTIAAAVPTMIALLGLPKDEHVHLFEEISAFMVMEVDPALTFDDAEIAYGDILWVEVVHADADATTQLPVDDTLLKRLARPILLRF